MTGKTWQDPEAASHITSAARKQISEREVGTYKTLRPLPSDILPLVRRHPQKVQPHIQNQQMTKCSKQNYGRYFTSKTQHSTLWFP